MNYAQIKAIEQKNRLRWLKVNPRLSDASGIYVLTRTEDGFKFAYIGQATHVLQRLCGHLTGYQQHIDLSLKKHGLYSVDNPTGWEVEQRDYPAEQLDDMERAYIKEYASKGYQLKNKSAGGQNEGKHGIAENKPSKSYRDGLAQGYKNAQRDVARLFDKNLSAVINGTINKNKEKALEKFLCFIGKINE